jgi:hypothetical protein
VLLAAAMCCWLLVTCFAADVQQQLVAKGHDAASAQVTRIALSDMLASARVCNVLTRCR